MDTLDNILWWCCLVCICVLWAHRWQDPWLAHTAAALCPYTPLGWQVYTAEHDTGLWLQNALRLLATPLLFSPADWLFCTPGWWLSWVGCRLSEEIMNMAVKPGSLASFLSCLGASLEDAISRSCQGGALPEASPTTRIERSWWGKMTQREHSHQHE